MTTASDRTPDGAAPSPESDPASFEDLNDPAIIDDQIAWVIDGFTQDRPFASKLIVGNTETQIHIDLDPQTVADLADALTAVRSAQRAAILGDANPSEDAEPAPDAAAQASPPEAAKPWWVQHKILLALTGIVAVCTVVSAAAGALSI